MSAVETIETPGLGGLVPAGSPVVAGRVHLGRLRGKVPPDRLLVLVGFGTLVWLGSDEATPPELSRLVYRAAATVDRRGRLVLDRRARGWLAVKDPGSFEVLVMAAPAGGVLVVPVEDFGRRVSGVTS